MSALGLPDGPDADVEVMPAALFAALSAAQKSVKILTPYFLPNPTLIAALNLCALRGVEVTIVTPERNNIPLVSWAAQTLYPLLNDDEVRINSGQLPLPSRPGLGVRLLPELFNTDQPGYRCSALH